MLISLFFKLEAKVELLEQKCSTLEQQNGELKSELEKVNRVNLMLRRNISSIFKTAKAELERKERQLKELQREYVSHFICLIQCLKIH